MELSRLTQLHISGEESLILLLKEVIIMYARIHDVQTHMMEFTTHVNKVHYMVRCIWVTLQAHRVMQKFVQGGLNSHPAIVSALTKQMGNNMAWLMPPTPPHSQWKELEVEQPSAITSTMPFTKAQ